MKAFNSMRTEWSGLWYKDSHIYISSVFDLKNIKEFKGKVRLLARKNKFYKKETNRPNMVFCIVDANAVGDVDAFEITDIEPSWKVEKELSALKEAVSKFGDGEYISVDDACEVARSLIRDCAYGYSTDDLCVEVDSFMRERAVSFDSLLCQTSMSCSDPQNYYMDEYDNFV